jgi:hypothetical protein
MRAALERRPMNTHPLASDPGVVGSAGALVVLAGVQLARPLPWPVWVAWGALAAVAVARAVRS